MVDLRAPPTDPEHERTYLPSFTMATVEWPLSMMHLVTKKQNVNTNIPFISFSSFLLSVGQHILQRTRHNIHELKIVRQTVSQTTAYKLWSSFCGATNPRASCASFIYSILGVALDEISGVSAPDGFL